MPNGGFTIYKDIEKLKVFQKADLLVIRIYRVTKTFPKEELYGLSSQLRRAAVSIPSNIAEGRSRETDREYKRFLFIARGSLAEVRYQIRLANKLRYIGQDTFENLVNLVDETGKLLNGLIKKVARDC